MIKRTDQNEPPLPSITFPATSGKPLLSNGWKPGWSPRIVELKRKHLKVASPACALLLLLLFIIMGCGTLATDQQSNVPFEDSQAGSVPAKAWTVEQTLVSSEVNCIAADSNNVWIATARGVSRWDRQRDEWLHYTMEDGLANDMVNAVAVDGEHIAIECLKNSGPLYYNYKGFFQHCFDGCL